MRNERVKEIATSGVFGALILFLALVPAPWGTSWGFIRVGISVEFTIIHIPVLIGAIFGGKRVGLYLGLIFGVGSLTAAAIYPGGFAIYFLNPLVSILPRVIFGFAIWYIFKGVSKVIKNDTTSIAVSMGLSTLLHTMLVVPLLFLFVYLSVNTTGLFDLTSSMDVDTTAGANYVSSGGFYAFLISIFTFNFLIEFLTTIFIGTPIVISLKKRFERIEG